MAGGRTLACVFAPSRRRRLRGGAAPSPCMRPSRASASCWSTPPTAASATSGRGSPRPGRPWGRSAGRSAPPHGARSAVHPTGTSGSAFLTARWATCPSPGSWTPSPTVLEEERPDVVLTFGPDGIFGHPDHIAVGAATRRRVLRFAAQASRLPAPPAPRRPAVGGRTVEPSAGRARPVRRDRARTCHMRRRAGRADRDRGRLPSRSPTCDRRRACRGSAGASST